MLVAVRRVLPPSAIIQLEIPSAPLAALASLPKTSRNLRAKATRTTHAEGSICWGLVRAAVARLLAEHRAAAESAFCSVKMFSHGCVPLLLVFVASKPLVSFYFSTT